jgi:hypothetical protein
MGLIPEIFERSIEDDGLTVDVVAGAANSQPAPKTDETTYIGKFEIEEET